MNKLPKTIYVRMKEYDEGYDLVALDAAEDHAAIDETRIVGVYQLKSVVEVSTQIRRETVVRKSPAKKKEKAVAHTEEIPAEGNPLLREMVVMTD